MEKPPEKALALILGIVLCLQAACTGPAVVTLPGPSWHRLKSGCYHTPEGRFFYGIGRSGGVRNLTLLRAAADNRAREELVAVLEQYTLELARSVPENLDPDWEALAAGKRRQILGMVVHEAMKGAVVSDHWRDSPEGGLLALCRLDLSDFKMVLSRADVLGGPMRSAMASGAEKVYARLARKL